MPRAVVTWVVLCTCSLWAAACTHPTVAPPGRALAMPNDNRSPAGNFEDGVLNLTLVAQPAAWHPDASVDTAVTVLAFAEEGRAPAIPGPLIRVPKGTEVRIRMRNAVPDSFRVGLSPPRQAQISGVGSMAGPSLVVHGLRAGTVPDDTLHVARGNTREVRYLAEVPGTYVYWAAASDQPIETRGARDAQLTGVIVVDSATAAPHPEERIFVITHLDIFPDSTRPSPHDNIFEIAINGLSWPHTERLHYQANDTVRWRWVNGSFSEHPMHLHGFHFRTLARGDGSSETILPADRRPYGVTELMEPGSTFRVEWVPTTPGNWIFHCHLIDHFSPSPFPEFQPDEEPELTERPMRTMAGLVVGIMVEDSSAGPPDEEPDHRLRLLAQQRQLKDGETIRSLILEQGAEPASDSVRVPGPPLLLTRGETTAITLVNRMDEATTIHWHGMELESLYDGVAGWSRTGGSVAPLVAPGDSFVVYMTPPREGTYIYHTHTGLTEQLRSGMYGPLLVLEPDESFDPDRDHIFIFGHAPDQKGAGFGATLNGSPTPPPVLFREGVAHRIRIINISADLTSEFSIEREGSRTQWRAVGNDGAALPPALQVERPAFVRLSAGETYDFEWVPEGVGEASMLVHVPLPTFPGDFTLRQSIRIEH